MKKSIIITILGIMLIGMLVLSGCGKSTETPEPTRETPEGPGEVDNNIVEETQAEDSEPTVDTAELEDSEEADLDLDMFADW